MGKRETRVSRFPFPADPRAGDNSSPDFRPRALPLPRALRYLAEADTSDSGYAKLKHEAGKVCAEPGTHGPVPGLDSAATAALCDSLKAVLAATDTSSKVYAFLEHATQGVCEDRRPPISHEGGFDRNRGRGPGRGGHH